MNLNFNPMLDEDDEILETVEEIIETKTDETPEKPGSQYWGREHSPEKIQQDAEDRKNGITPNGQKKNRGRRDFGEIDYFLLITLLTLQFLTARQVAVLLNVTYGTANKRLKGLQNAKGKYVQSLKIENARMIWFITAAGVKLLQDNQQDVPDNYFLIRPSAFNYRDFPHTLAVNQVAVHLLAGTRKMFNAPVIPLDRFMTERVIKSHFPSASFTGDTELGKGTPGERAKMRVASKLVTGELPYRKLLTQYPELWTLTAPLEFNMDRKVTKTPDLVLNFEDRRSEKPLSIAIEVELHGKTVDDYKVIMNSYKQDKLVYGKVIWFVSKEKYMKDILNAVDQIDFPRNKIQFSMLLGNDDQQYSGSSSL